MLLLYSLKSIVEVFAVGVTTISILVKCCQDALVPLVTNTLLVLLVWSGKGSPALIITLLVIGLLVKVILFPASYSSTSTLITGETSVSL